ncbi:MAG: hypothetical protein AB7O59_00930 [Pirellulales bacterium]
MPAASLLLFAAVFDAQLTRWVVWVGLVLLTVVLLLLIRTKWGQSQPLGKCVVLSLLAHLLIAIYFSTVNIVTSAVGSPDGRGVQVALVDRDSDEANIGQDPGEPAPWESFAEQAPQEALADVPDLAPQAAAETVPELAEPERMTPVDLPEPAISKPAQLPVADEAAPPAIAEGNDAPPLESVVKDATPIEAPKEDTPAAAPVPPPEPEESASGADGASNTAASPEAAGGAGKASDGTGEAKAATETPPLAPVAGRPGGTGTAQAVPEILKLRTGDHGGMARGLGATQQSEAAVNAALKWLAANQSSGGRWDPRHTGAGSGQAQDGTYRLGAGATADTGITGLALLAFLAAGNTHLQGDYRINVQHGLEYLLSQQAADGNLGASQNVYERMYCHAMATCAISEAYAMSRDERLKNYVRRAIGFTLSAQDRTTGGWRYRPGDPGDTSQLGWQVMALKSGQLAGLDIPDGTRSGIERFLKSVALGRSSGLACYQSIKPVATRSMTAEALVCRQFLGLVDKPAALTEASTFLLEEAPGAGTTNYYYWYYGTLALFQTQGDAWQRWNNAMQKTLISSQRTDGALAGSWDPDPVWGGCGGRAYSTALGTLCLEVYYRFLPLYVEAAGRGGRVK